MLAVKPVTAQLARAQPLPEQVFGWCWLVTHLPREGPQRSPELFVLARIMFDHGITIA